jgi:hypothetical protein
MTLQRHQALPLPTDLKHSLASRNSQHGQVTAASPLSLRSLLSLPSTLRRPIHFGHGKLGVWYAPFLTAASPRLLRRPTSVTAGSYRRHAGHVCSPHPHYTTADLSAPEQPHAPLPRPPALRTLRKPSHRPQSRLPRASPHPCSSTSTRARASSATSRLASCTRAPTSDISTDFLTSLGSNHTSECAVLTLTWDRF